MFLNRDVSWCSQLISSNGANMHGTVVKGMVISTILVSHEMVARLMEELF